MRVTSSWQFDVDGCATLTAKAVLEHAGQAILLNATNHIGVWSVLADTLIVDLPDHTDSPFRLRLSERGELTSAMRGSWRRAAEPISKD